MALNEIIDGFCGKRILVIGDIMLDEYIIGDAERISPEAPIPVVLAKEKRFALGGAANTANNISSLGANAVLLGVIGKKNIEASVRLLELLGEKKISNCCVFDEERETTRKTRVIARQQQMLRIDEEKTTGIPAGVEKELTQMLSENIKGADAIVVSDYAKGVLTKRLSREIMRLAKKNGKIVCVDSKNLGMFRNATIAKPNRKELENETGKKCSSIEECKKAALLLSKKIKPGALLVTLGAEGMLLVEGKSFTHIKPKAAEVFDVSGAGDTVIAATALALSGGATMKEAAEIASYAASVVIRKLGTAVLDKEELKEAIKNGFC